MSLVAKRSRTSARPAVASWIAARRSPTARAVVSRAMPSRSSAFQSGWTAGARNPIAKQPASTSCATSGGTLDGTMRPASRIHAHS